MDAATVKRLRKHYDETQEEFAERFGVSRSAVAMWESDDCGPPPSGPARLMLEALRSVTKLESAR